MPIEKFVATLGGEEEALGPGVDVEDHRDHGHESKDQHERVQDHQDHETLAQIHHRHLESIDSNCFLLLV